MTAPKSYGAVKELDVEGGASPPEAQTAPETPGQTAPKITGRRLLACVAALSLAIFGLRAAPTKLDTFYGPYETYHAPKWEQSSKSTDLVVPNGPYYGRWTRSATTGYCCAELDAGPASSDPCECSVLRKYGGSGDQEKICVDHGHRWCPGGPATRLHADFGPARDEEGMNGGDGPPPPTGNGYVGAEMEEEPNLAAVSCPAGWSPKSNSNTASWAVCDPSSGNGYRPNTPLCAETSADDTGVQVCVLVTGTYCAARWCTNQDYVKPTCIGRGC